MRKKKRGKEGKKWRANPQLKKDTKTSRTSELFSCRSVQLSTYHFTRLTGACLVGL